MQYDNYDLKMQKAAKRLRRFLKLLPKLVVSGILLTVTVVTLLATKGIVTVSATDKPIDVTYGKEQELIEAYSATAFLGRVAYEYSPADSDDWTREFPRDPGNYKVRAVAKATIGYRYGDEAKFTIHKRSVCVKIADEMVIYGENPAISADLAYDDAISDITFIYNEDRSIAEADGGSVRITDKDGQDVTSRYEISTESASIATAQRPMTVETLSASKVYDGSELRGEEYSITVGSLSEGDRLMDEFNSSVTEAGAVKNTASFTVLNAEGEDVTHYYKIKSVFGELTVTKRPITLSTESGSFTYDGATHSAESYSLTDGMGLVEGHFIDELTWSSIKNAGAIDNVLEFFVLGADGKDVSHNYEISRAWGTLTVNKRSITVRTDSLEEMYDGFAHEAPEPYISEGGLAPSETLIKNSWASLTGVGSTLNSLDFYMVDIYGNDTTDNYEIFCEFGTITVTPRPITVTTESDSVLYSGFERTFEGITVSGVGLAENAKHEAVPIDAPSFINVGDHENAFKIKIIDRRNGNDVTANYAIDYVYGTVTIDPLTVYIQVGSTKIVYDGEAHSYTEWEYTNGNIHKLVGGHDLDVIKSSTAVNVSDSCENVFVEYKVLDSDGNDVTRNYNLIFTSGRLEILQREVVITTASDSKIYDGKPLEAHEWLIHESSPNPLALNHQIKGTITGTQTDAGWSYNDYEGDVVIENGEITKNYLVRVEIGTLTVEQRPIILITEGGDFTYNAENQNPQKYSIDGYGLCDGHRASVTFGREFINVSDSGKNDKLTVYIYDENGRPVTYNYAIAYEYGIVNILQRPITVRTDKDGFVYDGKIHSYSNVYDVNEDLCDGHYFGNIRGTSFQDVDQSGYNRVRFDILDSSDRSVKANYDITYDYGYIEILPRRIKVFTESGTHTYDGIVKEYTDIGTLDEAEYLPLCEGHTFYKLYVPLFKNVWDSGENQILFEIHDENGRVVKDGNYIIECVYGTVTVTKLAVNVQTFGYNWKYDGQFHSHYNYQLINNTFFIGTHTVKVVEGTKIKNVGDVDNELVFAVYDGSEEVTENYDIIIKEYGTLTVYERYITIGSASDEKVYDGTALTNNSFDVINGIDGHKISADFTGTITNAGSEVNGYDRTSVKITDENGEDVTKNYIIYFADDGYLTITQREIYISSADAKKPYDGTELTKPEFVVDKDSPNTLLDGHVIKAEFTGTITDIGSVANSYIEGTVRIYDREGNEVTGNYNISKESFGTLTITDPSTDPEEGEGGSGEGEGEGENPGEGEGENPGEGEGENPGEGEGENPGEGEGENPGEGEGENPGEGEGENPGEGEGEGSGSGKLDTSGDIGGSLIEGDEDSEQSVSFVVTSDTAGYVYFKVMSFGNYTGNRWEQAKVYPTLINDKYSTYYLTAFALENSGRQSYIKIVSNNGEYVVPYYTTTKSGDVQTSDVVIAGDASSEYYLYYFDWEYEDGMTVPEALREFEEAYYRFVCENYLYIDNETNDYMQTIITEQGFDKNDPELINKVAAYIQGAAKYNLSYDTALDSQANIVIAFLDQYREGICQHYASAATMLYRALGIPARYTVGYAAELKAGEETNIGGMNAHAWVEVYIEGLGWIKVEVTGSGEGGEGGGEQPENKQTITLVPEPMIKEYDGTPLVSDNKLGYDTVLSSLINRGFTYEVVISGSQTNVGVGESVIESFILRDDSGRDVTDQYNIKKEKGVLRVTGATIKIYLYQKVFDYDGNTHGYSKDDYYVIDDRGMKLEILGINIFLTDATEGNGEDVTSKMINIDSARYIDYRVTDENGKDVTANYYIMVVNYGTEDDYTVMSVRKRNITITTGSATKVDDGEPLTNNSFYVSKGLLAEGHTVSIDIIGNQVGEGTSTNNYKVDTLKIFDENKNDVSDNYNITVNRGTLTIT